MKSSSKFGLAAVFILLTSLLLPAQERTRTSSEGGQRGVSSGSSGSRGIAVGSTTSSTASSESARSYSSSATSVSGGSYRSNPTSSYNYIPNLNGTSFYSASLYYQWYNYLSWLQRNYYMDSRYFTRFYRNSEPLITPDLLQMTIRLPLKMSLQMLTAIDELETLIAGANSGSPVNREAISEKTKEIRDLAKKIRQDESLEFFDQRQNPDILKGSNPDKLGLGAVSQLREMATDLSTQLKNMYNQKTASTISIESLRQPSFESLSKAIERLSKVVENSSKRL